MRRSRALVTTSALVLLASVTNACSVDHRRLHAWQDGGGSTGSEGGAGADPSAEAGAGDAAMGAGLVDGCADLDTDGVADCDVSLLQNSSFASDTSDWTADDDTALSWDEKNALSDADSGSARLDSNGSFARARQCVQVRGKQLVIAYANAFVVATADDVEFGQAELEVSFFGTDDCAGDRIGFFETPTSTAIQSWTVVQAGQIPVEGTSSVSLALVGIKPSTSSTIAVYFDNVMLKTLAL